MIEEKKIYQATERYLEENGYKPNMEQAFQDGARWAQQELLKHLWHDVAENPCDFCDYLVKTKQGYIEVCFYNNEAWSKLKEEGDEVVMWLDLNDILPKEGDK